MRKTTSRKAQIGIETLIVFIAMILVAAIAAAILINTQGMLQQQAQRTGEQSTQQVSTGAKMMSATGNVTGEKVDWVNMTVKLRAGSQNLDFGNATVHYIDDDTVKDLVYNSTMNGNPSTSYYVTNISDADDSVPVLNSPEDVFKLHFNVEAISGNALVEGEHATFNIQPAVGQQTMRAVVVPQSVEGQSVIDLT
ncbi:MAG: archaellin/type IV pilin N-terminal domain-containing protein [Halobacteria archaeon]|nr:archaellin/type IV pilin N-terminal domain-containing protein [Halobacteria archaeon]